MKNPATSFLKDNGTILMEYSNFKPSRSDGNCFTIYVLQQELKMESRVDTENVWKNKIGMCRNLISQSDKYKRRSLNVLQAENFPRRTGHFDPGKN